MDLLLVVGELGLVALILNSGQGAGVFEAYVLRPALWVLAGYTAYRLPRERPLGSLRSSKALIGVGLLIGSVQVACSVLLGLMEGFGKSPYSFTPSGLLVNLWMLSAEIAGMEVSRAWLANRLARRRKTAWALGVGLAYVPLSLPLRNLPTLADRVELVKFVGRDLLPSISQNAACAVLGLLAGPLPAIAYRGVLTAFWWFCPIIPDLSWAMSALVNTVVPVIGIFTAQAEHFSFQRPRGATKNWGKEVRSALIFAVAGMCLIWFAAGLFPVYPSVVATGSMAPYIHPGDMVVATKKVDKVQVGDIIEFRRENSWVIHRVVAIERSGDIEFYVTKGDANPVADRDPVSSKMVRGKVIAVLPKVGQASLAVKRLIQR